MPSRRLIRSLAGRYPLLGPAAWVSSIQFFVVQVVAASAWARPAYSWRLNAISDLGNTSCGEFDDRSVICSPWHGLMNASFIVLGSSMVIGSVLIYTALGRSRAGFTVMAVAGIGAVLVGVFPEDGIYWAHIAGADLALVGGNVALIVFGVSLGSARWLRWYSIVSGVVGLAGLYLFLSDHRFVLGLGGMERVGAYPQTIWLIVIGRYLAQRSMRAAGQPVGPPGPELAGMDRWQEPTGRDR